MFKPVTMLRMQPNGRLYQEELLPYEVETYLGPPPIQSIAIAGGLYLFCSWQSKRPDPQAPRITVLYSAAGRVRARIYGRTLMGRYTRNGYASVRDTDVEIAKMFVQVLEGKSEDVKDVD